MAGNAPIEEMKSVGAGPNGSRSGVGAGSRAAVRERRARMLAFVALRRVVLGCVVVGMTVGSAILAKEVRSAPALANIVVVSEPQDVVASVHAPDVDPMVEEAAVGGEVDVAVVDVPDRSTLVFVDESKSEEQIADELAIEEWGDLVQDASVRWFDGRPVRPAYAITLKVTAYSPDERSCGTSADGITATLHSVETNGHCLVAADPKWFPAGTLLSVPGYDEGRIVPVLDVGGAIKGRHIDVLYTTHERARKWGVQKLKVTVWEYADGKPVVSPRKLR